MCKYFGAYRLYIDLYYTDQSYTQRIKSLEAGLNELKSHAKENEKLLQKAKIRYKEIYDLDPVPPKR